MSTPNYLFVAIDVQPLLNILNDRQEIAQFLEEFVGEDNVATLYHNLSGQEALDNRSRYIYKYNDISQLFDMSPFQYVVQNNNPIYSTIESRISSALPANGFLLEYSDQDTSGGGTTGDIALIFSRFYGFHKFDLPVEFITSIKSKTVGATLIHIWTVKMFFK